ncbi:HNH endonuclease [Anaerocolumna cellulosilytica]|uniref:HNH endonuclease n=1 Tax=Anaerocolumna cellulosilytica TaxID=433286 RepID=A0A6S6QWZ0_9FIRM|nr:HNH endonuclease signature motif containing protein [Anaerocolumna cellulosilytica]MBB5194624.1 5-methylcytosine-specific restriction endonuclease McrA [Anaerocolumna cellulosilytica]BCJ93569.1 HNH endonuclease [Anaerocolumna cellulosilytica]
MGQTEVKRKAIPKKTRLKVYDKFNGHCAYCGCEIGYKDMQVDHKESLYWYAGADEIENYMPSCRACNFYKSTMTLERFREQLQKIPVRLEKDFIYRLAKKYGMVMEQEVPIQFYYEMLESK